LLNGIYHQLENAGADFRSRRVPEREDCFSFTRVVAEGGFWHIFRFVINDTQDPEVLIVVDFTLTTRRAPPTH
jgi:hypothetical protein